jgi:hypothetical protein
MSVLLLSWAVLNTSERKEKERDKNTEREERRQGESFMTLYTP